MWNEKEKAEYEKQVAEFLKKGGKIPNVKLVSEAMKVNKEHGAKSQLKRRRTNNVWYKYSS